MNTLSSSKWMKTTLGFIVSAFLLFASSVPCFALRMIAEVSTERAKELGMEVRANAAGPKEVRVELDLEIKGELKGFRSVSLEIRNGEKRVSAELREDWSKPGHVVVSFVADRANLDNIMLWVLVTGESAEEMTEYKIRVKDFVTG